MTNNEKQKDVKNYIVYGDYAIEKRDWDCFREDMKILGFVSAANMEDLKKKLIDRCYIDDINDIEKEQVWVVEYDKSSKVELLLEEL